MFFVQFYQVDFAMNEFDIDHFRWSYASSYCYQVFVPIEQLSMTIWAWKLFFKINMQISYTLYLMRCS